MRIDAIIPARGGSKGLYKKHTVLLGGKPLIEYTIEAAYNASSIRDIYLTTDDSELIERYKKDKRVRVIERPRYLATDDASLKNVFRHVLRFIGRDKMPDLLAILLPTVPFRTSRHIDEAVKFANSIPAFDSVASVARLKSSPVGGILLSKDGRTKPLLKGSYRWYRRQDQPRVYGLNGAIWLIPMKRFRAINNLLLSNRSYGFEMTEQDSVDVDTPHDVMIAEAILKFRKECFGPDRRGGFNIQRLYAKDDLSMGIQRNVFDAAAYERHFGRYKFFLKYIKPHDSVLDIACGSGYGTEILALKAKVVHGVDADAETVRYARRNHSRPNVKFNVAEAESFNPAEKFDKIISVETIEHLKHPAKFLSNARDWLKPDGEIWFTCPVISDRSDDSGENQFHISNFTRASLRVLVRRHFNKVNILNFPSGGIFSKDTLDNKVNYVIVKAESIKF